MSREFFSAKPASFPTIFSSKEEKVPLVDMDLHAIEHIFSEEITYELLPLEEVTYSATRENDQILVTETTVHPRVYGGKPYVNPILSISTDKIEMIYSQGLQEWGNYVQADLDIYKRTIKIANKIFGNELSVRNFTDRQISLLKDAYPYSNKDFNGTQISDETGKVIIAAQNQNTSQFKPFNLNNSNCS
jgi:hypothetical protein